MTTEIERKFVVDEIPAEAALGDGVAIRQGYLAEDRDVEVRIRVAGDAAMLTVKAGSGLERTEVEPAISREQAEALWPFTEGRRIVKRRHPCELGSTIAAIDIYDGTLAGLIVAEVEFESRDESSAFVAPSWFSREVTGQREWSNASLARAGRPP